MLSLMLTFVLSDGRDASKECPQALDQNGAHLLHKREAGLHNGPGRGWSRHIAGGGRPWISLARGGGPDSADDCILLLCSKPPFPARRGTYVWIVRFHVGAFQLDLLGCCVGKKEGFDFIAALRVMIWLAA
jgi:hypothetical protein